MRSLTGLHGLWGPLLACLFLFFLTNVADVSAQSDPSICSIDKPCKVGCCSKDNQCGFTPAHCGTGCQSNCNATAECGQYAPEGHKDCPINVCCSQHGFCGTTEEFCGAGCQKNSNGEGCGTPKRPSCPAKFAPLEVPRRIAYYELFALGRGCGVKEPEDLPLGALTHLNLAFVNFRLIDGVWSMEHFDAYWIKRAVATKLRWPHLRINIAIGGWAFNDAPTSTYFSDMASHRSEREGFIKSLVSFLREYGLDGVDIDWEYPVARERGGRPVDADNYVLLLSEIKAAFDKEGAGWEISIAIPSSYWYLRGFRLEQLQKYLDYFNLMSYDIYGMWDQDNEWTGPYLRGHTDWTMIDNGLDLLWRNGVKPEKVSMGFGFYGRSFTMENPGCFEPNGVCRFNDGGVPGSCSATKGVLTYEEIVSRNNSLDVKTFYEGKETTVKYNVFGGSQWVSYDDGQSFRDKVEHLTSRCLGGIMIWAIDQDTSDFKAFGDLMGDYSHLNLQGLDADSAEELADLFGQYNGQQCYVTERCTKDGSGEKNPDQVCGPGFQSVSTAHNPVQRYPRKLAGDCAVGWYRHICCPKKQLPKNCEWNGDPVRNVIGCTGKCGPGTFELNSDTAVDAKGNRQCHQGSRKLCCQSTKIFDDCTWTPCSNTPYARDDHPPCPSDMEYVAWRNDKPDGRGFCQEEYQSPLGGKKGSPLRLPFRSSLCCPKGRGFGNCQWSNSLEPKIDGIVVQPSREEVCLPRPCNKDKVQVSEALSPPPSTYPFAVRDRYNDYDCTMTKIPSGTDPRFPLCCDPPSLWNKDWPVDPEKLWKEHFSDKNKDKAVWAYDTQYTHNDRDPSRAPQEAIDGSDAYGFMMLNGPKEAIDDNFHKTMTVVRRTADVPRVKREVFTNNQTLVDKVFEHAEETFYAYCNFAPGSAECGNLFQGGAEDTIIRLPDHVGEGPFARVVSIQRADDRHILPRHHLEHRSAENLHDNPVWKIKIDYAFHLARQDRGKVQIRVDYTNLLGYWKEMTDSPATRRMKRNFDPIPGEPGFNMGHFRNMVDRGEAHDRKLGRRDHKMVKRAMSFSQEELMTEHNNRPEVYPRVLHDAYPKDKKTDAAVGAPLGRRWWGVFTNWLKKLTTVTKDEVGDLPLGWADSINIFRAKWGCPGKTWSANLRLDLNAELSMQATYAYYLSATFIPPSKPDMFFYFGIEPTAYLELVLTGNAAARLGTGRKKIIDTLAYPGLAIKGIAAVGPTMDVYGEIKGEISVHGKALAGCRVTLDKAQAYWPQDDKAVEQYDKILDLGLKDQKVPEGSKVAPTFEAGVALKAEVDVIIQPEANVGIKVGGSSYTGGRTLVDAQISAYLFTALQFLATGTANTVTKTFDYTYGVYLHWNVGYKARATVLEWVNWASAPREAFKKAKVIDIYSRKGSIDLSGGSSGFNQRRMVKLIEEPHRYENETMEIEEELMGSSTFLDKRQNGDDGDPMDIDGPDAPSFSQPIKCPDGDSPNVQLPELRMNCGAFPNIMLNTPLGRTEKMSSICDGIKTVVLPITMTHAGTLTDADSKRINQRRAQACKNNDPDLDTGLDKNQKSCEPLNEFLYADGVRKPAGYPNIQLLECDEFPWAASEEGGNFKDPTERSALCIPRVQNNQGGQCVDMLNELQTNVGKLEPVDPPKGQSRKDLWAYWGGKTSANIKIWYTDEDIGGVKNRLTRYDTRQPIPVGYDEKTWKLGDRISWTFKRNFTFDVINDGKDGKSWWDATKRTNIDGKPLKHTDDKNFQSIICAVNIFGQTDYFKYPTAGGKRWNAWCHSGKAGRVHEWDDQYSISRCWVDFGIATNVKRSVDGDDKPQWEAKSVTLFDEALPADLDAKEFLRLEREEFERREAVAKAQAEKPRAEHPPVQQADESSSRAVAVDAGLANSEPEAVTASLHVPGVPVEAAALGNLLGVSP